MMDPPLDVPCLVALAGPPGSGKTTWARRNSRGAVLVSQDGLIGAITPDGFDQPIATSGERWLQIAREASRRAIAVVMTTPESLCRERNAGRDAGRLNEKRMERMLAALEPVGADEGFACIRRVIGVNSGISLDEILSQAMLPSKGATSRI